MMAACYWRAGNPAGSKVPSAAANLFWLAPLATAEVFDPETRSFSAVGTMQRPHYLGVATKLENGMVLISGGWKAIGGSIGGERFADLFDPTRNIFSGGADLHVARFNQTANRLRDGEVMVAGGIDGEGNVTATVEFYAPKRGEFVRAPSTNPPRLSE